MRTLLLALIVLPLTTLAQVSFGVFVEPSYQLMRLKPYENPQYDSISALFRNDFGLGYGISIGKAKDRFNSFYLKPGFVQCGFMLERSNLQLFDVVHPSFGQIYDQSQAATKMAYMHHRFKYLSLTFEYHKDISPKSKPLPVKLQLGGGFTNHFLVEHDLKIRTEGFAINEKFIHVIKDDLYFEASKYVLSLHGFFETVYELTPAFELSGQVLLKVPVNSFTVGDGTVSGIMPSVNIGVRQTLF